ncbi:MAG: hypothetical protein ABI833_24115 [Acidobacteriota bacterium]
MRIFVAAAATAFLTGCSDSPAPVAKKAEPPPAPLTGRQAFQYLYGSSRIWAPDSMPLTIRSLHAPGVLGGKGTAGAWEVVFVSAANARARTYTWSAVEEEGLHKGVFPGPQETWHAGGANQPFSPALLKVDTNEALDAATKSAAAYLNKPGQRPMVDYLLDYQAATRFPNPVWHVLWGGTLSSAEYSVTVDASTGKVVGHD